jgi:hypothetical protein
MHWIDPDHLPEKSGLVHCFLINGEGDADGLILTDGTEVHFPPHMGRAVLDAIRPGAAVHIRGVRPRGVAMIAAVSIAPEEGERIVDAGPPDHDKDREAARRNAAHAARSAMEAQGVVRQALHGPKGEVRGVLLEDGRAGRFPPHAAEAVAALLVPGRPVVLRGAGFSNPHGTVIAVHEIGASAENLRKLDVGKPPPKKKHGDNPGKDHKPRHQDREPRSEQPF